MQKGLDIKLMIILTLFCTYIFPIYLIDSGVTISKFVFIAGMGLLFVNNILMEKKIKKEQVIIILALIILICITRNFNYATFFPLVMLDKVIENRKEIYKFLKESNLLYICLICTMIYAFLFFGMDGRYAHTSIEEINQSGLAIFCLGMLFMIKNKKVGQIVLVFGLLTFSRSYFLAVLLYLISNIKFIKEKLLKEKLIKLCNYFNLTIITSVILVLLGLLYIYQFKHGNILSDSQIRNRLFQFFDYSNFFRFTVIINMLLIFKHMPQKLLFGMTNHEYSYYGNIMAHKQGIIFREIVPHNLFFSHLKIYGLFAAFEIFYISKKIEKIINKDNFFVYLAIVAYSTILGAGLYSYWLFLSMFIFIALGINEAGEKNE